VHELLVVPNANLAYVPIFGDGIHGRSPNPGHLLCIIDLEKRCSPASADGRILVAVDDAQPSSLFLIDTADGRVTNEVRLEGVPKAAQIARCAPDNSLIGVTSLNSGTVSLDGRPQSRLAVSRWTWHSAMTNCFCQVTGLFASSIFQSGAQSTASAPARAVNPFSFVGRRAISAV
jgi:hypothetical protein